VISVIQTVTQLNDQTLALVPKIVAMVAATMLLVPWLATRLIDYAQAMFAGI
jgi:flagellar biosynthetic protein FliQ